MNPEIQNELELDRPASSIWERIFRFGVGFLVISTSVGTLAEFLFGEQNGDGATPVWLWVLLVLYLGFMAYCSNYMVYRFVKNKLVRTSWFLLMGLIGLVFATSFFSS